MRREDYQSTSSGTPIDLEFILEAIQVQFLEKLKLQIAFYRSNKVCKSTLLRFHHSDLINGRLNLDKQALPFCTTIVYDKSARMFQTKIINIQLALQIDSQKITLDSKFDLKNILTYPTCQRSGLVINCKNNVKLMYGIRAKINEIKSNSNVLSISPHKQLRDHSNETSRKRQYANIQSKKTIKFKSSTVIPDQQKQNDENLRHVQKFYSHKNLNINANSHVEAELETLTKNKQQLQQRLREAEAQIKNNQNQNKKNIHLLKESQQKLKQSDNEIYKLRQQNIQLKNKMQKEQTLKEQKQKTIIQLQRKVNQLQRKVKRLSQQSKTASTKSNDEQIALKKTQIQRLNQQIINLKNINKQLENKLDALHMNQGDWKSKYQQSERKNIKLTSEISQSHYQLDKLKIEEQKLLKKIQKLQKQYQQLKQSKQSHIGNFPKSDQNQKLTKQIQTKQEMIKMLKKENESKKKQLEQDINSLRKHNKQLRQDIQKLKNNENNTSNLELKVMNEKLKKQCAEAKRQEKKMLNAKSDVENKNKQMHQQIVKLKQSLARILNIVQQQGTSDLFTQVADCLS